MRIKHSKLIEKKIKCLYHATRIDKLKHYLANKNQSKAVFIWIPKNAGTSLYNMLKEHGCIKVKEVSQIPQRFSQRGLVTFSHVDYAQLVSKKHICPVYNKETFKFCFCRNPYDRAVSLYVYLTKKMQEKPTFLNFWRAVEQKMEPIGLYNSQGMSMCNPQYQWIKDIKMDFIGRYENYNEELFRLAKALNLPAFRVEHKNKSSRKGWQEYYCAESKAIIERLYSQDFKHFGYEINPFISQ